MNATIRSLLTKLGRRPVDVASLADDQDLYAAGLTSFSAVQLMLGIEDAFDIEFPERMLNRKSFSSISAIESCLNELAPHRAVA